MVNGPEQQLGTPEGDPVAADDAVFASTDQGSVPVVPPSLHASVPEVASAPLPPIDFSSATSDQDTVVPQGTNDRPVSSKRVAAINSLPVAPTIEQEAASLGYKDVDKLKAIVSIESSGNPRAGTGSYKGLGQLNADEFARYGDGGDIFDPRSNIRATIRSLQDKEAKFSKEFGRDPNATELYLMHQQGEGGLRSHLSHPDWPAWKSMYVTGEGQQKGEVWAKRAIWGNVPDDMKAKFGNVNNITSADFVGIWDSKLHDAPFARPQIDFGQRIKPDEVQQGDAPSEAAIMQATRSANDYAEKHGVVTEAFANSNLTVRAVSELGNTFAPDPDFVLTPELQKDLGQRYGLAQESLSTLSNAVSPQHAEYLAQQAQDDQNRQQLLASNGVYGFGAQLFAGLVDPTAIAAGAATGGLADAGVMIANGGRAARVAAQAIGGAAANVALDHIAAAQDGSDPMRNIGMSIATGAIFGAAYGRLSRNPATIEEAMQLRKAGQTLKRSLEDTTALTPQGSTVGAAKNPNAIDPFLNDPAATALKDGQVPYTYDKLFGVVPIRFSAAGIAKSSKNALTRLVAGIGLDGVGWKDHSVNEFSAGEEAELLLRQHMMSLHQVWAPAAEEFAKDQGYGIGGVMRSGSQFNEQVYQAVTNRNPNAEFPEPVKRVAQRIAQLNAEVLSLAKNPGERAGLVSRAVQGFQDVKENPNYMMRVYAGEKLNAVREDIGDEGLRAWTRGAIRKAQPDLTDEEVDKLSRWHIKRVTERANGIDEKLNLALSGFDREQLKDVLREAGVEEERVDKLLAPAQASEQPGADARAKRRLLFDEGYVLRDYPSTKGGTRDVSLNDMVVTDAALLTHLYSKHMFGRIALSNFKVRNPETGELIINGITSDNEWLTVKNKIARWAGDNMPGDAAAKQTESDVAQLDYMYDRILGRSDKDAVGDAAKWLQRFADVSYVRLGGNFGMAQLPEYIAPVAHLGIKAALSVMPAFKRMVTMDGESVLKDDISRTVEAMWGLGADHAKGFQYFRHEDVNTEGTRVSLNKVDNALGFAKQAVSHLSGLHIVNAALQRWTGKAIIQRFADMARKAVVGTEGAISLDNIGQKQLNRMRYLGLSDDMLKRVLSEMRDNITTEKGMLFDHKVTRLNMDGWKDQEARAAFENAGFRWARNIIQENDIGAMHRWMAKPLARMLMQFRVFPLVAWDKQMLHNLHMKDMTSFNLMWMSMVSGAATYALQSNIAAIGRSDREDFLSKRLAPDKIALGGFQRAGWTTLLPTIYDTGAYMVGGHPAFDFRTSGQASDAIFGNPVMSTIDDISKMSKGIVAPLVNGRERSQQEYRNIARMAPLATWLPATTLLSTMISNKPLAAPKSEQQKKN